LIASSIRRLEDIYDALASHRSQKRLESLFVSLAIGGFLLHLLLIFCKRTFPGFAPQMTSGMSNNFLQAVYTPFSFILFYEVLLLVFALPKSLTTSIGKQYEIISLIVVRRVFKDIGTFDDFGSWLTETETVKIVLLDMGGALLMFFAVTLFYRVRKSVVKTDAPRDLKGFVRFKKVLTLVLGAVLIVLATGNFVAWFVSVMPWDGDAAKNLLNLEEYFFPAFFEFMIFTDVLLLIVSIRFYDRYEYLFRNSGFVISTVLLRISLSTDKPYDLAIALIAIFYGLCLISFFAYFTQMSGRQLNTKEAV
jgi:hypothetical protein